MADRIGRALERFNARAAQVLVKTYTYRRGANSVSLSVIEHSPKASPLTTLAMAVAERDLANPSPKHGDHQFSFPAADLIINATPTTPAEGDTIERTADGATKVYKVMAPLDGGQMWRYSPENREEGDEARIRINARLHSVT